MPGYKSAEVGHRGSPTVFVIRSPWHSLTAMPGADYISPNVTEVERTGQDMGSILNRSSIELLYDRDTTVPGNLSCTLRRPSPQRPARQPCGGAPPHQTRGLPEEQSFWGNRLCEEMLAPQQVVYAGPPPPSSPTFITSRFHRVSHDTDGRARFSLRSRVAQR